MNKGHFFIHDLQKNNKEQKHNSDNILGLNSMCSLQILQAVTLPDVVNLFCDNKSNNFVRFVG